MAKEAPMSEQNTNTYFRIRLSQVPANLEDIVTTHSFDCGASGVSEALVYTQPDLTYDPTLVPVKNHELDVFFSERPGCQFFDGLLALNQRIQWNIFEEENKDWLEEWKKGFKPFQLIGPYWIVPSWEPVPAECQDPISIDPGMAFGTGTHATTKMMAFFIQKLSDQHRSEIKNWSLLDVGTGTAILAMLAQKNGFARVLGIEIDPEARRVARENVKLNKLEQIEISDLLLEEVHEQFDVVVANIIDGVLIQIKNDLLKRLKPGGHLFLTGILEERDAEFYDLFIEGSGLKLIRRLEKDEWVGYWLRA